MGNEVEVLESLNELVPVHVRNSQQIVPLKMVRVDCQHFVEILDRESQLSFLVGQPPLGQQLILIVLLDLG